MHICVSKLTIIGSDNGLSPGRGQAIAWTNPGILLTQTLWTNFSETLSEFHSFSFKVNAFENVVCEMASVLYWPQWVKLETVQTMCRCNYEREYCNPTTFRTSWKCTALWGDLNWHHCALICCNGMHQDYVYVKGECQSTLQKIKHYLHYE